jgi:uncharacterized alkaline shock family protein YloU
VTATERGRTVFSDRAVTRIAARAVGETTDTGCALTSATVDGGLVTAQVDLAVRYPSPVREVTRRVRRHVRHRVEELTGLTVHQVDIEVTSLEVTSLERAEADAS